MHALFLPLVASKRYQQSHRGGDLVPHQRHSTGALTVRRPRETIPVNFRVVMNFDISIDVVESLAGGLMVVSGLSGGRNWFFFNPQFG